jgi:hypothetical protein
METGIIISVAAVFALVIIFFIAKRVLRLAIRLALALLLVLVVLAAGAYVWWRGWFSAPSTSSPPRHATSSHR